MGDAVKIGVWIVCLLLSACWSFSYGKTCGYQRGMEDMADAISNVLSSGETDIKIVASPSEENEQA